MYPVTNQQLFNLASTLSTCRTLTQGGFFAGPRHHFQTQPGGMPGGELFREVFYEVAQAAAGNNLYRLTRLVYDVLSSEGAEMGP